MSSRIYLLVTLAFYAVGALSVLVHAVTRRRLLDRWNVTASLIGFAAHTAALSQRWNEAGHFPVVGFHDAASFLAWTTVLAFLATYLQTREEVLGAGLDSIPGGGAEVLYDRVREVLSPKKIKSSRWLEVMEAAHRLGRRTTATMMFGSIETPEDIITHLDAIRQLQDRTGGFTAFIPWTFQPGNTELQARGREKRAKGKGQKTASTQDLTQHLW